MKYFMLSFLLLSSWLNAEDQSADDNISQTGQAVREQLKNVYLSLHKSFEAKGKTTTGQKKILSELQRYNQQIVAFDNQASDQNSISASQWKQMNDSLKRIEKLTSYVTVGSRQKQQLSGWVVNAREFSDSARLQVNIQPISTSKITTDSLVVAKTANDRTKLIIEDGSLGFNTPAERRKFMEDITALRTEQSRAMTRAGVSPADGAPIFPAAYIYSNGSYGNATNLGRRDSFTPVYSNRNTIRTTNPEPLIQIRVRD